MFLETLEIFSKIDCYPVTLNLKSSVDKQV